LLVLFLVGCVCPWCYIEGGDIVCDCPWCPNYEQVSIPDETVPVDETTVVDGVTVRR